MKQSLKTNESGMAIITALLVIALASGLMAGMFAALLANQRSHASDRDQSVAYAAAHAGLEKLTAALADLFVTDFSPSSTQIGVIDNTPPSITGFEYTAPGGATGSGYQITFTPDANGNPQAFPSTDITTGPFEGFKGLVTPYTITVTARSTTGNSEVRLRRELQTVAVPVFQFGVFGEKSLGFHAGPTFDFGGRVHTNERLYLAGSNTLTFRDKITAFIEVVRNRISNGQLITATGHTGAVSLPTVIGGAPGTYRNLASTEGSGTTATPWAGWKNLSEVTYHTNIRTEATGAKQLRLPLVSAGATPIDLIRRPAVLSNENTANPAVFGQRYFAQASLRILLSDRASDITDLPGIVAGAPVDLANLAAAGYVVAANRPPVPLSPGPEPYNAANGVTLARVSNIAGSTLTVQTSADGAAGWNNGVPTWLKWASMTVNGVGVSCTGLTGITLSACGAHAAAAVNSPVVFTLTDGTTVTTAVSATTAAALNSATITLAAAFDTALKFTATRVFFVGEDPVTCTGFTINTLTGCSWSTAASASLAANDPVYTGATTTAGTPLVHGFIRIEKQNAAGVWSDVTMEILNLGFAAPNQQGAACGDPTPNAVIRLMRMRDNGMAAGTGCTTGNTAYATSLSPQDFRPNTLFDAREGSTRLLGTTAGMNVGGLFSYVALDVDNFRRWAAGTIPAVGNTGSLALNNNGYIVYFSDRRGDHNENDATTPDIETGEYGFEDSINPAAAAWAKSNALEGGEDFNENGTLESYGETPHALVGFANAIATMGFDSASRPWTTVGRKYSGRGRLARPVLFRRALKIINGGMVGATNNLPVDGFTVTSENPVYIQGNYNATAASVTAEPNRASAIIADSITLLSNSFSDHITFLHPNDQGNRAATDTGYRFAMTTGKSIMFTKPAAWGDVEMGSDGGVHNFMKMLEDWGGRTLRYRGSMVSLYYSRQAIGIYRADANIYGAPTRGYNFDTDFLVPALLPPGTPMFRDINTLKFRQILRPNQ